MIRIDFRDVFKHLELPDGRHVDVIDWFPKYSVIDENRNLFLRGVDGKIIWQVRSDFDVKSFTIIKSGKRVEIPPAGPFTGQPIFKDGRLRVYRWDGFMYDVNIENGFATPAEFVK